VVPIAYGALETTRKRSAGNGTRNASPCWTDTAPQLGACIRRWRAQWGSSSTASTRGEGLGQRAGARAQVNDQGARRWMEGRDDVGDHLLVMEKVL
jgi:hypothetical protein